MITTSRRGPGAVLLVALVVLGLFLLLCCLGGESGHPMGTRCADDNECGTGLVCSYGRCRGTCELDRDCEPGQACVASSSDPGERVCTLLDEGCTDNPDVCVPPLECGLDGLCREPCDGTECNAPRVCRYGLCVEPDVGELPVAPLAGTWHGIFYMAGGPGCLCLTLDTEGNVVGDDSSLYFRTGDLETYPVGGGRVSEFDPLTREPTVVVEFYLFNDEEPLQTIEGNLQPRSGLIDGDYVVTGVRYQIQLDRMAGQTCGDLLEDPAATC